MTVRTDLALERHETLKGKTEGILTSKRRIGSTQLLSITVQNETGAKAIQKPIGRYDTLLMEALPDSSCLCDERLELCIQSLNAMLPESGSVLVAGLGNRNITPDALGAKCADYILATRHLNKNTVKALKLPDLRCVSAVAPGVTGQTGIEALELIKALTGQIKPDCVIVVDALACAGVNRLAKTVQLCNTGLEPGSGVGNSRPAINREALGVPVIAIGVPTVADAYSLAAEVLGVDGDNELIRQKYAGFTVTPKDTDVITESAARFIALAVNCCLQKNLSAEEMLSLMLP